MNSIPQSNVARQLYKVDIIDGFRSFCSQMAETGVSDVSPSSLGGLREMAIELHLAIEPIKHDPEKRRQVLESVARTYPKWQDIILGIAPTPTTTRRKFEFLSYEDLLTRPRRNWLMRDIVSAGDTIMLYGESGSGKSMLAIDLFHAAIMGRTFANSFPTPAPFRILYCAGEGLGGIPGRFKEARAKWNPTKEQEANFSYVENVPQLFTPDSDYTYINFIEDALAAGVDVDLIAIDTYHTATAGANENDAGDTGTILAGVNEIKQRLNCAVMIIHHANKNNDLERGSGSLKAACDTVIFTKRNGRVFELECRKQKDGEQWKPLAFGLRGYGLESLDGSAVAVEWLGLAEDVKEENEGTRKDVLEAFRVLNGANPETWFAPKDICSLAGVASSTFSKRSKELLSNGKIEQVLKDPSTPYSANKNPYLYRLAQKSNTPQKDDLPDF